MTTTILSSNRRWRNLMVGMLKKNLSTSIYLLVLLLFFFPLQMLLETQRALGRYSVEMTPGWLNLKTPSLMYTSVSATGVFLILTLAAVVVGLTQVGYLHSRRAVDLYHSLPVNRAQLMSANFTSAFLTIITPFTISYLLNVVIAVVQRQALETTWEKLRFVPAEILLDYLSWLVVVFVILAVVFFVASCVGSVFENLVFSCEVLLAPMLVVFMNQIMFDAFLVGYDSSAITPELFAAVSPLGVMFHRMTASKSAAFHLIGILVWLLLGVVVLVAALILYRRRRSELAETSGCRGVLGLLFSTVVIYIGAPLFGLLLGSTLGQDSDLLYLAGVAVGSVLTYLLMAAILNRGFYGVRRWLPAGAGICAFVVAVSAVITSGGLGFEARVPNPGLTQQVELDYRGWYSYVTELDAQNYSEMFYGTYGAGEQQPHRNYKQVQNVTLSSPEAVEAVVALHRQLIPLAQQEPAQSDENNPNRYYVSLSMKYQLGGSTLARRYSVQDTQNLDYYRGLEATAEFQEQTNPLLRLNPTDVLEIELNNNLGFKAGVLTQRQEMDRLLEALAKDAREQGTQGFDKQERVVCYLYIKMFDYEDASKPAIELDHNTHYSFSVPVLASYQHTLRELQAGEGASVLQPGKVDEITAMGVNRYPNFKNQNVGFVSGVGMNYALQAMDNEGYSMDSELTQTALDTRVDFRRPGGSQSYFYCTFYKDKEMGVTIMVPREKLLNTQEQGMQSLLRNLQQETGEDMQYTVAELVQK